MYADGGKLPRDQESFVALIGRIAWPAHRSFRLQSSHRIASYQSPPGGSPAWLGLPFGEPRHDWRAPLEAVRLPHRDPCSWTRP